MDSIKIYVRVCQEQQQLEQDSTSRDEVIEISKDTTLEEVKGAFLAAADVAEDDEDAVVLTLRTSDGAIVPISAKLESNTENNRYVLDVYQNKLAASESIKSIVDGLSQVSAATPSQMAELKESLQALKLKLENKDSKTHIKKPEFAKLKLNSRYVSSPKYVLTEETKQYLRSTSLDNWLFDNHEIMCLMEFMFEEFGLIEEYDIKIPVLRKFLLAIKDCYNDNPFHNFRHSFCVTQMMFGIVHSTDAVKKLNKIDKLILLLACVGHDLDHPGFNNAFQVNALTELAITYNDQSPLENHHSAVLFTILSNPELNILANVKDATYRDVRKNVIRCIIGTDMAKHGDIMGAFKKAAESFNYDDVEHKTLLLQMIVKCSDISNEVRPTDVSEPWCEALLDEFFCQSDAEKAKGLPFAPFMDRDKVTKPGAQIGFISFVMIPLYELAAKVLPNMEDNVIRPIKESLLYYKQMQERMAAAASK